MTVTEAPDFTELDQTVELHRYIASGRARELRANSGLTIPMVARTVGVSPSLVSRWERNDRRPRGEAAARYLDLLRHLNRRHAAAN